MRSTCATILVGDMELACDTVLMGLGDSEETPVPHGLYPCNSFNGLCDTRAIPVGYGAAIQFF